MIQAFLSEICHQDPARTLAVAGVLLPACARCTGVYWGWLLAFLSYAVPDKRRVFLRHPSRGAAVLAAAALIPGLADLLLATFASSPLGNAGRFLLAIPFGWGGFLLIAGAASWLRWGASPERRLGLSEAAARLPLLLIPPILLLVHPPAAAALLAGGTAAGAVAYYALLTYLPAAFLLHKRPGRVARGIAVAAAVIALAFAEILWGLRAWAWVRGHLP